MEEREMGCSMKRLLLLGCLTLLLLTGFAPRPARACPS